MALRVSFLVDGFNLYHSLRDAEKKTGVSAKWLDLRAFCQAHLQFFGKEARLEEIHYFSAYAAHLASRNPDVVTRHQILVRAFEHSGVKVEMGRFKAKDVHCYLCKGKMVRHEEKETDVAIAVRLVELLVSDRCDLAVVLTGDTDIAPGIRTAKRLAPTKRIAVVAPYGRANSELKQIADHYIKVRAEIYAQHLFPAEITLLDGRALKKPISW